MVPTFLAAEEIERQYVEKMGPKLGDIYYRLFNECARVHEKWSEYAEIFGVKERVELVNSVAPSFFRLLQDVLWDDVLLHIARLTDEAKTAGQRDTLSIRQLPALVNRSARDEVRQRSEEALSRAKFARDWRNRRLAHTDLALALGSGNAKPLQTASRALVAESLEAIAATLNIVQKTTSTLRVSCTNLHPGEGALALLYILRDGLDTDAKRRERLSKGEWQPEESGAPPALRCWTGRVKRSPPSCAVLLHVGFETTPSRRRELGAAAGRR